MNDTKWQAFLEQFPIEYRSMLDNTEFQNSVLQIYANSCSEDDAHAKIKLLIEQYNNDTIEFEIWKRTHIFQWWLICTKSWLSVLFSRIKSMFIHKER